MNVLFFSFFINTRAQQPRSWWPSK